MNWYYVVVILFLLFITESVYFKIAHRFNIIDKPNHRSSHTNVTIRGGGIIFPLSLLMYSFYCNFNYPWFLAGLLIIAVISFIDDLKPISSKIRIGFHLIAVSFLFIQLHLFLLPLYCILFLLIFIIFVINAVNFMDGINGITGLYGLITLCTLFYINNKIHFTSDKYLIVAILSMIVFLVFNFRTRAKCFAGDVGSVSVAFILAFFIFQLVFFSGNFTYLLFLLVYLLDTISTIIFRLFRKENIFEAHRSHFYQFLANEKKMPHLLVAFVYGIIQLLINILILNLASKPIIIPAAGFLVSLIFFAGIRLYTQGFKKLVRNYN